MKVKMFAICDTKAECFLKIFTQNAVGEAMRTFKSIVEDPQSLVSKNPEDFALYELGEWDMRSGIVSGLSSPKSHGLGINYKSGSESPGLTTSHGESKIKEVPSMVQ